MYSDGDLRIATTRLDELIAQLGKGNYSTYDFIQKYQGFRAVNKGISVDRSWNAVNGKCFWRNPGR